MGFGGFFVLKIVVLFLMKGGVIFYDKRVASLSLMRGWSHIFTIKG
ncbi:hypothetical protein BSPWISOXPB_7425 [uncultured Gammaproteobacteria bacterium]|nr:hypothetical protein BSPWISOXPB_7425 [uncultured Gammaproteobacteria bacterium]